MAEKGKIITISGSDGSGKQTQTKLLVERLREKETRVETISFPFYESFTGKLVREYLDGRLGTLKEINPKLASLPYALDRLCKKEEIEDILNKGYHLILDRYVQDNVAHQAAKFSGKEREELASWIEELEFKVLKLPCPDLTLYLDLPINWAEKAMDNERRKKDIHESNEVYLNSVRDTFRYLAGTRANWVEVDCLKQTKRERKTVDEVNQEISSYVEKIIKS